MRGTTDVGRDRSVGQGGSVTGLCIECAIRYHDFKEIVGRPPAVGHLYDPSPPRAWIDGRRHVFLPAFATRGMCRDCGRPVAGVYVLDAHC